MFLIFAIIGFIVNLVIFLWFALTLNSINKHLETVAEHSERHTRMMAAWANATGVDIQPPGKKQAHNDPGPPPPPLPQLY